MLSLVVYFGRSYMKMVLFGIFPTMLGMSVISCFFFCKLKVDQNKVR